MKKCLAAILLVVISPIVLALPVDEISHLLAFVETTGCRYERNGDSHSGTEAVTHIKRKYEYYSDDIETAEDFIQYSATKSKISGKFYTVHCPGQPPVKSKDWLLEELNRYRATQ